MSYFAGYDAKKPRLRVLILGSYTAHVPNAECEKRLVSLRHYLQSVGYANAKLALDFSDEPKYDENLSVHSELKSKEKIESWAHGLIFVFLKDCNNDGVSSELTFVDDNLPNLFHSVVVLEEKGTHVSSMINGPIARHEIEVNEFESDEDLKAFAQTACTKILRRNFTQI